MRGLVIDYARSRRAKKRGRQFEITGLRAQFERLRSSSRCWRASSPYGMTAIVRSMTIL